VSGEYDRTNRVAVVRCAAREADGEGPGNAVIIPSVWRERHAVLTVSNVNNGDCITLWLDPDGIAAMLAALSAVIAPDRPATDTREG
jgi:hypothetical protein